MKRFKKIIPAIVILLSLVIYTDAQTPATPVKKFIFSAIKGANSKADSIMLPVTAKSVRLTEGDTAFFKIGSFKKIHLTKICGHIKKSL